MNKVKFVGEFEFNASKKMLYPYLNSASGLAQWFADDVNINADKHYIFLWDGEESTARMVTNRLNEQVKFKFISEEEDPNYVEFKLDKNEITGSVYLQVTDYSEMDEEEAEDLWSSMVHDLKEIVGG